MSRRWHELRVTVIKSGSDAVANFLIEQGSPGLQSDDRADCVLLIAYFAESPPIEELRRFCAGIGIPLKAAAIETRGIHEEDWAQNWKLHFRPQCIGERLYVCPPWETTVPPGRVAVVIDPGMAFGTGQHASTRGCLRLLEWAVSTKTIERALDLGSGSGVLAIALAKLNVPTVWAIDTDPQALAAARSNAGRNGVQPRIAFGATLDDVSGPFDLTVANLFSEILKRLARRLGGLTSAHGIVICSGLLAEEETCVRDAYEACGFAARKREEEDGWVTLGFQRNMD